MACRVSTVVLIEPCGTRFSAKRVPVSSERRAAISALKACARGALNPDGRQGMFRHFRLAGAFPEPGGESEVRLYGFHAGPGHPNRHEPPPGLAREPIMYGSLLATRTGIDGAPADLTVAEYRAFVEASVAAESLGEESDTARSTDGDDSGSDLRGFIVPDDAPLEVETDDDEDDDYVPSSDDSDESSDDSDRTDRTEDA